MSASSRTDRGAVLVEFALIVPVLFLMIAAIVDFGYRYQQTTMINNAAQVAARDLAINHSGTSAIAAAKDAGAPDTSDFSGVPSTCTAGANVTVLIKVNRSTATKAFGQTFTASGKGVARCSE